MGDLIKIFPANADGIVKDKCNFYIRTNQEFLTIK